MAYGSGDWPGRSLLGVVSGDARRELMGLGVAARFRAGEVVLREGDRDRHVVVLLSGFAKVTARVENGEESLLAVRVGGETVGEMAAMDGAPRSATVTACGVVEARVVSSAVLHALLVRRPEVHLALTGIVAGRLRWANRRRLDFRGYPAKVRLARLLVELATSYGHPVNGGGGGVVLGCRLTQPELAALTGAAETTVHKGLRELREDGLLETGYGSTVIRDLGRLREIGDLAPDG
ncbi:Crp/Fnr family transcriptional regulator [Streptomyces sp. NPDC020875]|uniref:Crp/Fnr family transcriptional regulator n=1 Tax=Streptomyces sp. NPDC020875 TaxID=3154898 RepID=UPI0033DDF050